jgi:hypothetical protein
MPEEKALSGAERRHAELVDSVKGSYGLDDAAASSLVNSVLVKANVHKLLRAPTRMEEDPVAGWLIINNCAA